MKNNSILMLTRYSALGASSRLRSLQYIPELEKQDFKVTVSALFDDDYINALYLNGQRRPFNVFKAYFFRFLTLINLNDYDLIWIEKELFPFVPGCLESVLIKRKIRYIVDYDDAIFHNYDLHRNNLIRFFLGNKLKNLLKNSSLVTAGNDYLGSYARNAGAKKVHILPTVIDLNRYSKDDSSKFHDEFRIGWIGSPSTTKYLQLIKKPLHKLAEKYPVRLVTIGASPLKDFDIPLEQHSWSEDTEVQLLNSLHVGIMPLPDSPWERGKCGYKLIQYMACGKAVIASPVGMNINLVTDDVGLLARTERDWFDAIQSLLHDKEKLYSMGVNAKILVKNNYSLQASTPELIKLLNKIK